MVDTPLFYMGRVVGKLRGRHLVKRGKVVQLYRVLDGFSCSEGLLEKFDTIEVHYNGRVYLTTANKFRDKGIVRYWGEDKQYVLPRRYWDVKDNNQERLL